MLESLHHTRVYGVFGNTVLYFPHLKKFTLHAKFRENMYTVGNISVTSSILVGAQYSYGFILTTFKYQCKLKAH